MVTTIPTRRSLVRACAAPLMAYGITVAASLAVMVLVVLALALGSDGGGDSDPSSELDVEAIGTLVGMPFQLAAMALGGSLRLGDAGFAVSLFAPPLLLTATFLLSAFWLSRRAEREKPSASTLERALLAGGGSFATAVVVTAATRLLAMRDDGVDMHAASVGLFLGTWALGFVALLLGRTAAHSSLWPRWLPADGRRAAHLVAQHVVAYVLVVVPVAVVWVTVQSGVEGGLFALVWGPTVGLHAFGLGHLGASTALGEHQFAWDLGWLPGTALPLLAVVLAVTAAVAWHARRDHDHALLAQPASWAALPVAYAVGALAVCLLSSVGISGVLFGVGGGFVVSSAYWLIPVLAVWGAVIEVLSRSVAPVLAGALPPAVVRRLSSGPARLVSAPAAPVERIPMSPADRARARAGLIGAGVVGGLAIAAVVVLSVLGSTVFDPELQAEAYLDAVVDGDIELAVELAPVDTEASDALLTDEVYGAGAGRVTGYEITDVEELGDTVTVTVDLEGVEDGAGVQLTLASRGSRALFFDDWEVADGGLTSVVTVPLPEAGAELVVNGVPVPVEGDTVDFWALPGTYSFDPYGASEWLESSGTTTTVPASSYGVYAETAEPLPSQELRDAVDDAIAERIDDCMASEEADPAGCPQEVYVYGDEVRNLRWTLVSMPTVSWDAFYGTFPVDLYSDGEGQATVTYEYDESYGFGRPDWVEESEDTTFYVSVTVDLVDGQPQVTFTD